MLFSIITICLNSKKTILRTIKSVISQKNVNIQYIIVDGASTDGTLQVIKEYADFIDIIISEKDNGISDAFNKGISMAKGRIIGIINSDDWYEPEALYKVQKIFNNTDAEIVYSDTKFWTDESNSFVKQNNYAHLGSLLYGSSLYHPSVFVLHKVYKTIGLFSPALKYRMDYDFLLRCKENKVTFYKSDFVLSNYQKGGVSTTEMMSSLREEIIILNEQSSFSNFYIRTYFFTRLIVLKVIKPLRESLMTLR